MGDNGILAWTCSLTTPISVFSRKNLSLLIVFGHFVIPFCVLLGRNAKRSTKVLTLAAIWMLIMHFVDIYWLVMPSLHHSGSALSWIDLVTFLGIGGITVWLIFFKLSKQSLVPFNDPNLEASIKHRM